MVKVDEAFAEATDDVDSVSNKESENMSIEALMLMMNTDRIRELEEQMRKELAELKGRQQDVHFLHDLLQAINKTTSDKDKINWEKDKDLKKMLDKARELGVDIPEDKYKFNEKERQRLIENIRMEIDDLNLHNDLQFQTVTRLTNERYESYQLTRAIMKPLHEDKVNKMRKLSAG